MLNKLFELDESGLEQLSPLGVKIALTLGIIALLIVAYLDGPII